MIKPEYITPDAKYDVMRYLIAVRDDAELNAYAGNPPQSIESQIAGILNVLIDAGIVSPPCKTRNSLVEAREIKIGDRVIVGIEVQTVKRIEQFPESESIWFDFEVDGEGDSVKADGLVCRIEECKGKKQN